VDADLIIKDFRRGASVIVKLLSDSFLIRGGGFEVASCGVAGRISKELLPKTLGVGGRSSSSTAKFGVGGREGNVVEFEDLRKAFSDLQGGGVLSVSVGSTTVSGSCCIVESFSGSSNVFCSTLFGLSMSMSREKRLKRANWA